jgi:hypothetical protein
MMMFETLQFDVRGTDGMKTIRYSTHPLAMRRPLPLITPALPWPMMVFLEATVIPMLPALSYETAAEGELDW